MTLTTPYSATFIVGDGVTKTFSYLFDEVSENFISVIVYNSISGLSSIPTYTVDTDQKQIIFGDDTPAPTADETVCIYRNTPNVQDVEFRTLRGYDAKALENILSKIVAMIQEIKSNYFTTQVLQGDPWQLDLLSSEDDGATVNIDYTAKKLVKGLYFRITDGNLQVSADDSNYITMPKSTDVAEFRQLQQELPDHSIVYRLQYRVGNTWYVADTSIPVKYGASFEMTMDSSTYIITATLKDQDGNTLGTPQVIDLPMESVVVGGSYDDDTKSLILTLENGNTITIPVADLIAGLQAEITNDNKLDADLVDDSTSTNKFVTASDKTNWDGKVNKSGDTMTGELAFQFNTSYPVLKITQSGQDTNILRFLKDGSGSYSVSFDLSQAAIHPLATGRGHLGTSSFHWGDAYIDKTYTATINNGADITVPATGGTMALTSDVITALSGLTDVTITSATSGDLLQWDGSKWVNAAVSASPMTGATASTDGVAGIVPTPHAGDQDKVLKGDGTWGEASTYHPDLFDFKWADHIVNDVQWLRADTFSWQSGSVYEAAFWDLFYDIQISTNWYREGAPGYTAKRYPEVGDTVYLNSDLTTPYTTVEAYDSVNDTITAGGNVYTQNGNTYVTPVNETVGGYTVSVYTGHSGKKITIPTYETAVSNIYSATGVAWYYILDIPNKRFKLPRTKFGFTGLRDTVGNYVAPGLPNITADGMACIGNTNPTGAVINKARSGYAFVNTNTSGYEATLDASRSSSVYGSSDTIQPPATQMYLYFYVGEFTQTALENTAGLNASLFNGKVDIGHQVIEFQEPNAGNDYTWYRKYADGWVEQGGFKVINSASVSGGTYSQATVNFPVSMSCISNWNCQAKHDRFNAGFNTDLKGVAASSANAYQVNDSSSSFANPYIVWEIKGIAA